MRKEELVNIIKGGLIVSCYAGPDINPEMGMPETMACVARSCVAGGAVAIRTNAQNVKAIKEAVDVPVIAIRKIYENGYDGDFRITPTMDVVDELVSYGADAIAIDATKRRRYDDNSLEDFVRMIKEKYPDLTIIADISTIDEAKRAYDAGCDIIGSTLSGYTPYSENPVVFGEMPLSDPDYKILKEMKEYGIDAIIAEGRYDDGFKMQKALDSGATAVVIGTSITMPKKIVQGILIEAGNR